MDSYEKSYAQFSLINSVREVVYVFRSGHEVEQNVSILLQRLRRDEERIAQLLDRPAHQLKVLEIGAGQRMERARYFTKDHDVTVLDQDIIPCGIDLPAYWRMLQENGFGRVAKTVGRKLLLVDYNYQRAWQKAMGVAKLATPTIAQGDICSIQPGDRLFDLIVSWSTFEHLPDPQQALKNVIASLKPGGVFLIGIHLYTSNSGHHDIRAFTGGTLPAWAHLRSSTAHLVEPSSYLNQWSLAQWRSLFSQETAGYQEFLETYESEDQLTPDLKAELHQYSPEELCTVDAFYLWKKPEADR